MNKKKIKIIALVVEFLLVVTLGLVFILIMHNLFSKFGDNDKSKVNVNYTANGEYSGSKSDESLYTITPGFTYFVDKGSMELYADIIKMANGNIFVFGEEFHTASYSDDPMKDATIKEELYYQGNNTYVNANNNLTVTLSETTAIFKDTRQVALAFNGELKKINKPMSAYDNSNQISNDIISEEVDIVTKLDTTKVTDIKVDEYSTDSGTSGTYVGKDFESYLTPSYEKKDLSITAKYIESTTNSGTKYQDIHSGKYFYVFGGSYKFDSSTCNTVTITGTYRGTEKRFNGLQMDDSYPCFVLKNMRKPTEKEVGE